MGGGGFSECTYSISSSYTASFPAVVQFKSVLLDRSWTIDGLRLVIQRLSSWAQHSPFTWYPPPIIFQFLLIYSSATPLCKRRAAECMELMSPDKLSKDISPRLFSASSYIKGPHLEKVGSVYTTPHFKDNVEADLTVKWQNFERPLVTIDQERTSDLHKHQIHVQKYWSGLTGNRVEHTAATLCNSHP